MSGDRLLAWCWIVTHPITSWRIRRWARAQWADIEDVTR